MPIRVTLITLLLLSGATAAHAQGDQLARGRQTVQSMAGCYLVDYSYVEVQDLKPGYVRDPRVYDVNRDKSAKEWIVAEALNGDPPAPAAHPVPERFGRKCPGRHDDPPPVGGLGVRRRFPLRLRRAAYLAGARPPSHAPAVDPARDQPA